MSSSSEEQRHDQQQKEPASPPSPSPQPPPAVKECVHKTKLIQFLGRTTPIVLQNDNGPCPLLAICNVLLLRNNLSLSPNTTTVSQEKLLSLVAERLIDSNSNFNNKDEGYVENQQQNIADAIDLLPRLATGIDVNIKFRRIDDFEFTPECAIFDLLDIPLYHGWIVDPQDYETVNAIGSRSYNALVEELVVLDTQDEHQYKNASEEDYVDFAAATTATLGVPSPNLSKARSFDDSPHLDFNHQKARKGDLVEEAELLRALKLSEADLPSSLDDPLAADVDKGLEPVTSDESSYHQKARKRDLEEEAELLRALKLSEAELASSFGDPLSADIDKGLEPVSSDESSYLEKTMPVGPVYMPEKYTCKSNNFHEPDLSTSDDCSASRHGSNDVMNIQSTPERGIYSLPKAGDGNNLDPPNYAESDGLASLIDLPEKSNVDTLVQFESSVSLSSGRSNAFVDERLEDISRGSEKIDNLSNSTVDVQEFADKKNGCDLLELSCSLAPNADLHSDSSSGRHVDASEALTSSVDGSEPIYEGEECILDLGTTVFEEREPIYEGEVVLANQADKSSSDSRPKDGITPQAGELIRNFLKNNASQLTFSGLFCLLEGLKERELCVFFRNNHFSTMFKFNGELYLLATDQGYINQPDLVWEKLNEVNGDTLFMTGSFKEFKVEHHANETWNEHNAMTSTVDYIASMDSAAQAGMDINPDLQLAIALQQQEFDQNTQHQNTQQQPTVVNSRLITGPPGLRSGRSSSTSISRSEQKLKDKCTVM